MSNDKHLLFSYGTLQLDTVQFENYGRLLRGEDDKLIGYKLEKIQITDSAVLSKSQLEFHSIAIKSVNESDFIEGKVFEITSDELVETDKYEVIQYHRILEILNSGKKAWIYVAKNI